MRGFSGVVRSNPFSLRFRQGIVAKSVFLDQPGAFEHTHVFPKPSRTLRVARLRRQLRSHGYDKSEPVLPVKQLGVLHHPIPIHVRVRQSQPRQAFRHSVIEVRLLECGKQNLGRIAARFRPQVSESWITQGRELQAQFFASHGAFRRPARATEGAVGGA